MVAERSTAHNDSGDDVRTDPRLSRGPEHLEAEDKSFLKTRFMG